MYSAIGILNDKNKNITIELFQAKHLEDTFLRLSKADMITVLGGTIPNPNDIEDINYQVLNEVIEFILHYDIQESEKMLPKDPNFEDKIKFNSISESFANFLRVGNQQTYVVEDFFEKNSNFVKEHLRNKFQTLYKEGLEKYRGDTNCIRFSFSLHSEEVST